MILGFHKVVQFTIAPKLSANFVFITVAAKRDRNHQTPAGRQTAIKLV